MSKPLKEVLIQRGLDKSQARYAVCKALMLLDKIGPIFAPPGVSEEQFEDILKEAFKAVDEL